MSMLFQSIHQASIWIEQNTRTVKGGHTGHREGKAYPRVKDFWLMGSILPVTIIIVFYLAFVLKIGPNVMKFRRPLNIDRVVIIYNAAQVLFSIYLVTEMFRLVWLRDDYRFFCFVLSENDPDIANQQIKVVWMTYLIRFLDLFDTIFYVLRKKQNQVTFLHVYHHTLVIVGGWCVVNFYAGEQTALFGTINSCVHIIMYTYYLLSAVDSKYKKVWWKKYLTLVQMVQFVILGLHGGGILLFEPDCQFPRLLVMLFLPQAIFMFILFGDFYRKAYAKHQKDKNL